MRITVIGETIERTGQPLERHAIRSSDFMASAALCGPLAGVVDVLCGRVFVAGEWRELTTTSITASGYLDVPAAKPDRNGLLISCEGCWRRLRVIESSLLLAENV